MYSMSFYFIFEKGKQVSYKSRCETKIDSIPQCIIGLNIFIHISIYSNIQIYILQYNHDGIATYTNLFPYEHNGAV